MVVSSKIAERLNCNFFVRANVVVDKITLKGVKEGHRK